MTSSRDSRERRIRGFVTAAAVVGGLLAGIVPVPVMSAEPFDSNTDMGALRLQLGQVTYIPAAGSLPTIHDPSPPRLVYETKAQTGLTGRTEFTQLAEQGFLPSGKCGTSLDATFPLATLTSGPYGLGMGPDSLGVYDGPKGVACYRISAGSSAGSREWIGFDIGLELETLGARSFYRLELDIEVKQGARFELQILRGGVAYGRPWILESGSSISDGASPTPGVKHWACTARSDSGPDAGSGDNCRWVINDLGDGFILLATAGEGSWEGGGDWGPEAYDNNSIIFLTDAEVGVLGCKNGIADGSPYTSTIGDGMNSAQCAVTRVDPTNYGGTCRTNIAYLFRTVSAGVEGCELEKNEGEQMAAVIDVVFPPEPSVPLNSKLATVIQFPVPGSTALFDFEMPRCKGTLVLDANGDGTRIDGISPDPTIAEVLADPPPEGWTTFDVIPTSPNIEWACILEDEEDFLGKDPTTGDELMRVRQKILFWGDPIIIRQKE